MHPFHSPIFWACKLQTKGRWGWSNHNGSYPLSFTSVISASTTRTLTLTAMPLLFLYIRLFTLYQSRKLWEMFKWIHRVFNSPALEESHLSEIGLVMYNSHLVALPQSHSSEFVSLGWWWCTWPAWPAQPYEMSPLCQRNQKRSISVEDSNPSGPLVFHEVGREALHNLALHFLQLLLPPIFNLSPPPVGISFSQDQVIWLKWNGISFPVIMMLLSLCLWCGLHLSLFKGLLQSFMQLGDVVVNMLVFLCTPWLCENRSWWASIVGGQTLNNVGCIQWWPIS